MLTSVDICATGQISAYVDNAWTTRHSWITYPPPRLWTWSHGEQDLVTQEVIPHVVFKTNCLRCISFAKSKRCQDVLMQRPPQTKDKISQDIQTSACDY